MKNARPFEQVGRLSLMEVRFTARRFDGGNVIRLTYAVNRTSDKNCNS